jgi:uncharacterized membrane protein
LVSRAGSALLFDGGVDAVAADVAAGSSYISSLLMAVVVVMMMMVVVVVMMMMVMMSVMLPQLPSAQRHIHVTHQECVCQLLLLHFNPQNLNAV